MIFHLLRSSLLLVALWVVFAGCSQWTAPGKLDPASTARSAYTPEQLSAASKITEVALAPDGDTLALVSDMSGALELWTAPLSATRAGALTQVTFAKEQVTGLAWSPAGDLVFLMDQGGNERPDLWLLRRGTTVPARIAATEVAEQSPRFSPDGGRLAYSGDPDRLFRFNLFVRDLITGAVRQLTHESINVLSPRWSRDGETLVATVTPDDQRGELVIVPARGGRVRRIPPATPDSILWPVDFLPDGRLLALTRNAAGFQQLCTVTLDSGVVRLVGPGDAEVEEAAVLADGRVVLTRNRGGESEILEAADGNLQRHRPLGQGGVMKGLASASRAGRFGVVRETATRPSEVVLGGGQGTELSVAVPGKLGALSTADLSAAERIEIASFDGQRIDAWLWAPRVARLGTPPPAIVWVHGGPGGQIRPAFIPEILALAEAGFLVIAPNYRGSSGYGRAFEDLNNRDWGGGDLKDLIAAVDHLRQRGRLDRRRVGITGGSYGGYMTLQAITARPEQWAAAVECYGMPDLVADYELTKDRFGSWYETEMGTPSTHAELFRDRSPLNFLHRIRAPLLVLQGANDSNVPKAESDLVVEALRKREAVVEYVVYPNEGHGFTHRENRLDAMCRTVDFFTRHLGSGPNGMIQRPTGSGR